MTDVLFNVLVTVVSFAAMEAVAWFTHKYIMHGVLWTLHRSHHTGNRTAHMERNDLFFLFFAIPGIAGLFVGMNHSYNWMFFSGLGITLYGITYFVVHDVFIHRRLPFFRNTDNRYLLSLRRAHKVHHKNIHREGATCFGMLLVPFRYHRRAKSKVS